jgi:hypothetical protein
MKLVDHDEMPPQHISNWHSNIISKVTLANAKHSRIRVRKLHLSADDDRYVMPVLLTGLCRGSVDETLIDERA